MLRLAPLLVVVGCGSQPAAATGPLPPANHVTGPALALAFVFNGQEVWIGNDKVTPEDDAGRFLGALDGLEAALDAADLAHGLPAGSLGTAIVYADHAKIVVPMGPIAALRGAALGTQKTYYGTVGTSLVAGIELAQLELDKTNAAKKVLIVVGDGNDTNIEAARPRLAALKAEFARSTTAVFAIILKGALSDPVNVVTALTPDARTITSATELPVAVAKAIHDCCKP